MYIPQPCARRAHRNLSTGIYSPNVCSLYPIHMNLGSFLENPPPNFFFWNLSRGELVLSGTCPPGNLSTQEHVYLRTCPGGTCLLAFLVVFGTVLIQAYIYRCHIIPPWLGKEHSNRVRHSNHSQAQRVLGSRRPHSNRVSTSACDTRLNCIVVMSHILV